MIKVDLAQSSVRELNQRLHRVGPRDNERHWRVVNPNGAHAIAVGLTAPIHVEIKGHVGYYCAGMMHWPRLSSTVMLVSVSLRTL